MIQIARIRVLRHYEEKVAEKKDKYQQPKSRKNEERKRYTKSMNGTLEPRRGMAWLMVMASRIRLQQAQMGEVTSKQ